MKIRYPNLNQREIAQRCGVCRQSVNRWIAGRQNIQPESGLLVAAYYVEKAAELMTEAERIRYEANIEIVAAENRTKHKKRPHRHKYVKVAGTGRYWSNLGPLDENPDGTVFATPALEHVLMGEPVIPRSVYKGDEHRAELFGKREDNIKALKKMRW